MSSTIAIIGGTGSLGMGLALHWVDAGEDVVIGSRDRDRAKAAADRVRTRLGRPVEIGAADYAGATGGADIVILTVPFSAQIRTMKQIRDHLKPGTVLVDTTVPLSAAIGGRLTRTLVPWAGSAAQQAAELTPQGVKVVATLHTISAQCLDRWPEPIDSDVLITGDDADAKAVVGRRIENIPHLRAIDAGPLEMARVTEHMTALLVGINRTYKTDGTGIRITGLPRE